MFYIFIAKLVRASRSILDLKHFFDPHIMCIKYAATWMTSEETNTGSTYGVLLLKNLKKQGAYLNASYVPSNTVDRCSYQWKLSTWNKSLHTTSTSNCSFTSVPLSRSPMCGRCTWNVSGISSLWETASVAKRKGGLRVLGPNPKDWLLSSKKHIVLHELYL